MSSDRGTKRELHGGDLHTEPFFTSSGEQLRHRSLTYIYFSFSSSVSGE